VLIKLEMNKKILLISFIALFLPFIIIAAVPAAGGSTLLNAILQGISNAIMGVGTVMATIGFVVAGVMWLTSGGSPERTGLARKALIAAVIGSVVLVIGASATPFITMINQIICGGGGC